jgi:acetyltransferase-like isoleucine patch superfamily enzyme
MRKLLNRIARRRLSRESGVAISPSARVNCLRIRMKDGGSLAVGQFSIVDAMLIHDREGAAIRIGDRTFIGDSTIVSAEAVTIGNDVLISWGCTIVDHDSHALAWSARSRDVEMWYRDDKDWSGVRRAPVRIGNKAWIGFNAIILKGVTIGEGAVVAAGSVVTGDVSPWTVVAGNPAKPIRQIDPHER